VLEHLVRHGGTDEVRVAASAELPLARGVGVDDEHLGPVSSELLGDGPSEAAVSAHDDVPVHVIRAPLHRRPPEDVA